MKQSSLGLSNTVKRTRKRELLDAMERVVPWAELVSLSELYAPESGCRGQQPFAAQTLLRSHFMQQWFKVSDPAMEEALLAQGLQLKVGTVVDDTLISAQLDQEPKRRARSGDAPEQEGQPVVLWNEGPHRRGRRLRTGAYGAGHGRQRLGYRGGPRFAARARVRACEGALPGPEEEHAADRPLFVLGNLWMARHKLLAMAQTRPQRA